MKKLFLLVAIVVAALSVHAQGLHGDMESWRTYTVDTTSIQNPAGWFSYDSLTFAVGHTPFPGAVFSRQTFKTSDAHSGNFAAKIVTRMQDTLGVAPGVLVNAQPQVNLALLLANPGNPYAAVYLVGGTPVSQRIAAVNAWIKYLPAGSDNGEILVEAHRKFGSKDSVIGRGDVAITALSSYTEVQVNISYTAPTWVPQTLVINFFSTALGNPGVDNSTMYIDDVSMAAVSVENVDAGKKIVACYPNPCKGFVNLDVPGNEKLHWTLYNISGQKVAEKDITGHTINNVSSLDNGIYFYNVSDENGVIVQRDKLSIVK